MAYFSNGTEAAAYEEHFCSRCLHYDVEIGVDKPCPIWLAHILYAYEEAGAEEGKESNAKKMLDMLIPMEGDGITPGECSMFVPRDKGAEIPGQLRLA